MDWLVFIFGGLSVGMGIVTAMFYMMDRNGDAFVSKMIASTSFIIAGIFALCITKVDNIASALIVVGMVMSFWGDFFLARREMSRIGMETNFAYGVYSFAISQILFVVGFLMLADFRFSYYFLPLLVVSMIPLVGGKLTHMLTFKGKEFMLSMLYGLLLCLTLVVTASRYYLVRSTSSLIAMIGAISFLVSDMCLGMYYFSSLKCKKIFNYPIMIFYFLAEILYAISMIV